MGFLKKMNAKLEDLYGFLKENKSKIGGFPPIRGIMKSMTLYALGIRIGASGPYQTS